MISDSGINALAKVGDLVRDGEFQWPFPHSIELMELNELSKPRISNEADSTIWVPDKNGIFSVKSAWNELRKKGAVRECGKFFWSFPSYTQI